jgi:anti-sigma-K factor RskA
MTDDRRPEEDDDVSPASYADLAALAKTLTDDDSRLDEPPADLWARIEAHVTVTPVVAPTVSPSPSAPPPASLEHARARRDRKFPLRAMAIAAAVVVVALVAGLVIALRGDDDPTEVASVALVNDGLDPRGVSSHGDATLVRLDDGTYALDVAVADLPSEANDFYELWIIDPNVEGMVSLGPLPGSGRFHLPPTVDPSDFPIVDISIEPTDGVPTHSGDSILRGILET